MGEPIPCKNNPDGGTCLDPDNCCDLDLINSLLESKTEGKVWQKGRIIDGKPVRGRWVDKSDSDPETPNPEWWPAVQELMDQIRNTVPENVTTHLMLWTCVSDDDDREIAKELDQLCGRLTMAPRSIMEERSDA